MDDVLEPLAVLVPVFGSIILFFKLMTDYWLKKKIVDKGLGAEDASALLKSQNSTDNKYSSLKWGLILLFGGLGLVVINYVPYYRDSPLPFGLFTVFVALGFLVYYFYVKKETDNR
jgi:hypothetical protein